MSERGRPAIAETLAAQVREQGADRLFGVPGGGPNLEVIGAAEAAGLRFVLAHSETAGCIMASTYGLDYLCRDGSVLHDAEHRYLFSSWNTVYRQMLDCFPAEQYLLGHELVDLDVSATRLRFANGVTVNPIWWSAPMASVRRRGRISYLGLRPSTRGMSRGEAPSRRARSASRPVPLSTTPGPAASTPRWPRGSPSSSTSAGTCSHELARSVAAPRSTTPGKLATRT